MKEPSLLTERLVVWDSNSISCDCISTHTDAILNETHFRDVNRAVYRARGKWFLLGTELKVKPHILFNLSDRDHQGSNLETIVRVWLMNARLQPCWAILVEALRNTVDEPDLAQTIITEFLGML